MGITYSLLLVLVMHHSENCSMSPFELDLEFILERIQHCEDVVKEEVRWGMERYWEAVRACNKEHRWMRQHDALQEVSLAMGGTVTSHNTLLATLTNPRHFQHSELIAMPWPLYIFQDALPGHRQFGQLR